MKIIGKKSVILFCSFLLFSTLCTAAGPAGKTIRCGIKPVHRIMTCNIRIAGLEADDTIPGRKWEDRRDVLLKVINSRKPDIICTQEVIYKSYHYMKRKLSEYSCYGFEGPEMDPYTDGYHVIGKNVIFWRKSRYKLVSSGCYWLSDKPYIGGSLSWGTARARHCNWVRLRDRKTGEEFRILDVHLDHISEQARQVQMKMVIEEASQYQSSFPQILCGDFNSGIKNAAVKALHSAGWKDLYEEIHGSGEAGYTCHGFLGTEKALNGHKGHRIDFIFSNKPVDAVDSEIIKDSMRGIYPSDHYFLMADVTF